MGHLEIIILSEVSEKKRHIIWYYLFVESEKMIQYPWQTHQQSASLSPTLKVFCGGLDTSLLCLPTAQGTCHALQTVSLKSFLF